MNIRERFIDYIRKHNLFSRSDQLIVGVSGGIDSVVLCHLLHASGYTFIIAHCNFGLRGEESDRDETFVKGLGAKLDMPVLVKRVDLVSYMAAHHTSSVQVAAREVRYDWFRGLAEENRKPGTASVILTAHHLQDNVETVLMNFLRGTGVRGLRGIEPRHSGLARPLLFLSRDEIATYASDQKIEWVEDSSNATLKYARNHIRNRILPAAREIYPAVDANISANINRFAELELIYDTWIESSRQKLLEVKGNEVHIPVLKLAKMQALETIVYEIFSSYGFSSAQVKELIELLDSSTGRYISSSTHRVIRNRKWLIVAPITDESPFNLVVEQDVSEVEFDQQKLRLSFHDRIEELVGGDHVAILDASELQFPLIIRKWKQGDYFYPLGMPGKKKVARFLIDRKVSRPQKEKILVVQSGDKICWIVGHRIDHRFRVRPSTQRFFKMQLSL